MLTLKKTATIDDVMQALADEGEVRIVGFGTFSARTFLRKNLHNVVTGQKRTVGPVPKVTFKGAKSLRWLFE